jgi:hypothetical protein
MMSQDALSGQQQGQTIGSFLTASKTRCELHGVGTARDLPTAITRPTDPWHTYDPGGLDAGA